MRIFGLLFCTLLATTLQAQFNVKFIVTETTFLKHDSIYITGTFSNWDSTFNPNHLLKPLPDGRKFIQLKLPAGAHRYKFTRGNWYSVEKFFGGNEVSDRTINVTKDTVVECVVASYRDEIIKDKRLLLASTHADTSRVTIQYAISSIYNNYPEWYNLDSALYYNSQFLSFSEFFKAHLQGFCIIPQALL